MSNINYLSINENFPVAGQDNDTQVFRDNFDTIKTSLRNAKEEITSLETNAARINAENNFETNTINNAVFQNCRDQKNNLGPRTESPTTIEYENGPYQILTVGANITIDFLNFPGDPSLSQPNVGVGKVMLELYSTVGGSWTVNFSASGGTVFKKDPDFPATVTIDDSDNPVFIEVWRHGSDKIFLRYLGKYS